MKFFQEKSLGRLMVGTSLLAALFPVFNLLLIYPRFQSQILEIVKSEARQVAQHLSRKVLIDGDSLRITLDHDLAPFLIEDFGLVKIKVIDRDGLVIYSSEVKEVGVVNQHDFFSDLAAKGQELTRMTVDDTRSAERETLSRDVLEIYHPIMRNGAFIGVFALYYDISDHRSQFDRIYLASQLYPAPIIIFFICLVGYVLKRLDSRYIQRIKDKQEIEVQHHSLLNEQEKQRQLLDSVEYAKRQWEATMDRVEEMVILADPELMIRRCNKAVAVFYGRPFSEILNRKIVDIFPGLGIEQREAPAKPVEYRHETSNRIFSVAQYRVTLSNGEDGVVITLHDQTEIKKMTSELEMKNQEILNNSQELQRAIDEISNLIQRVVVQEDFGTYFQSDLSQSCYQYMGCEQEDCPCYGKDPMRCWQQAGTFCGGDVQGKFAKKFSSCAECSYFITMTTNPINLIGEQFNNMMRVLESKNKALQSAYTELKQTQSQLLQHEKMASVGQLAAGVAHEINNPVGFIASNLNSLRKYGNRIAEYISLESKLISESGIPDLDIRQAEGKKKFKIDYILSDIDELISESLEGCERVKKIVQDLKGFSRVDQASRQSVDIHECLESTINIVWNELKYKAKIVKDYQATTPITCFPQQLNQVFMNLLVNAAHAIDKEGIITIKTIQDDEYLSILISDTGCGMPPEIVSRIFEPFYTTKDVGKGTGLGLSIVYDIVTKNHHGEIMVASQVGQGSLFTVKIPLVQQ